MICQKQKNANIVVCRITNLLSKDVNSLLECEKAELADLQHKLDNLYKHKAERAFIRSRRRWIEEGEQNSDWKENKLKITKLKHLWLMAILLMIQEILQSSVPNFTAIYIFQNDPQNIHIFFSDVI